MHRGADMSLPCATRIWTCKVARLTSCLWTSFIRTRSISSKIKTCQKLMKRRPKSLPKSSVLLSPNHTIRQRRFKSMTRVWMIAALWLCQRSTPRMVRAPGYSIPRRLTVRVSPGCGNPGAALAISGHLKGVLSNWTIRTKRASRLMIQSITRSHK